MTLARSIKLGKKQQPPADLALFKSSMGSAGLSQRISASNLDAQLSFLYPCHKSPKVMRIFRAAISMNANAAHRLGWCCAGGSLGFCCLHSIVS